MALVTSKRFILPLAPEGLTTGKWFNMWSKRLWPYDELEAGETLLWYESPNQRIVWSSKVIDVIQFEYQKKNQVEVRLALAQGDADQPYFVDAPESGFCLSYRVEVLERLSVPKPDGFRFPQIGWLRIDDSLAQRWPELAAFISQ
jgi:hypothetical protein